MIARFKLTGVREGDTVLLNDRYQFVNGVMDRTEHDGRLLENLLTGYYECEVEWIDDTVSQDSADADNTGSLAKSQTAEQPPAPLQPETTAPENDSTVEPVKNPKPSGVSPKSKGK